MTSKELRQKYLEFFQARGHKIIPSASLIPENDPSLLFTNSGMSPLVPYLLGEKHPEGTRLTNSQKCFRSGDIDEVGDSRHNTFFEMLGNWSLGDYFKKDQLNWWYEFLVEELKLDPNRLYQTVYLGSEAAPKDEESIEILQDIFKKYGVSNGVGPETPGPGEQGPGAEIYFTTDRIFAYRDKNWWQRGDAVGELGGPDSETFYDTGKKHDPKYGEHCHANCDCGRFVEIGNSVFLQYVMTQCGWEEMKNKNVDFGGGLERMIMAVQDKSNIFETDLFANIIHKIEMLSGKKYVDVSNKSVGAGVLPAASQAFEVIADHIKAAAFIMGDDKGIAPSNIDQGYIVRRLIRRAIRYGKQLGIGAGSPGLMEGETWTKEIAKIAVHDYASVYPELNKNVNFIIEELKKEETKFARTLENGLKELQRIVNNKIKEMKSDMAVISDEIKKESDLYLNLITGKDAFYIYSTYGFPYEMIEEEILKLSDGICTISKKEFNDELKKHQELSRTASVGKFKGGLADASEETTKLHTAAHLLLAALRQVLGDHVTQKGSNITAERLRFDFAHAEKMTDEQKQEVERLVNVAIEKNLPVVCEEMTLEEAKEKGAMGVFESKYGEKVKVYKIGAGDERFSYEICGGPHVENTSKLGHFRIKKEESSSAGVRRIKAVLD